MRDNFKEKEWEENPNPKARTAFVIFYPFQYYVYKNIYKHFDDAEFIVDFGAFSPIRQSPDLEDDLVAFLKKKGVYYRVLRYSDYFFDRYLEEFFSKYSTLVGVWERGCHLLSCNKDKKQVSVTYGAGKELVHLRFSRRWQDLILAFGERDAKLFSLLAETKIVGNPKFDDWFNNDLDEEFMRQIRAKLDKDKKTILYLPTHSDLSSLGDLMGEFKALTAEYNVIVKMHYFTIREEPEKIEELLKRGVVVLEDDSDLLPLLKIADVVLSDNSSAIFDAILADKPLVVTDFLSTDYLDNKHKELKQYHRGQVRALTYSGSIEQVIKRERLVITMRRPSEALAAIGEALKDGSFYRDNRRKLIKELFSFNDGECGLRAAKEIKKVSAGETSSEKPILFHAIENHNLSLGYGSFLQRKERDQKNRVCEDILLKGCAEKRPAEAIYFSVIVLDLAAEEDLEITLRSLSEQRFPADGYEVSVVSVRDESSVRERLAQMAPVNDKRRKIKFYQLQSGAPVGGEILKAVRSSDGEIVCFTRSGYLLPATWLTRFLSSYERFPGVAGVGGYVSYKSKDRRLLEDFYYAEIGKKLGILGSPFFPLELYEVRNNIFRQNPAGSFGSMSYKKDVLEKFSYVFDMESPEAIALGLKVMVMADQDICFIPYPVYRTKSLTLKEFMRENLFQGRAVYSVYNLDPWLAWNCRLAFIDCLAEFFSFLVIGRFPRKAALSGVIFIGYLCRWIGKWHWKLSRIILLAERLRRFEKRVGRKNTV